MKRQKNQQRLAKTRSSTDWRNLSSELRKNLSLGQNSKKTLLSIVFRGWRVLQVFCRERIYVLALQVLNSGEKIFTFLKDCWFFCTLKYPDRHSVVHVRFMYSSHQMLALCCVRAVRDQDFPVPSCWWLPVVPLLFRPLFHPPYCLSLLPLATTS